VLSTLRPGKRRWVLDEWLWEQGEKGRVPET
jgi:hypothetical protein